MRPVAKCLTVALGAVAALGAAVGPVLAHDGDRWDDRGWKHGRHVPPGHVYYVERPVVIERPVYVAPPPRVYYPEPMYYGPPQPPPSINFNIPLR